MAVFKASERPVLDTPRINGEMASSEQTRWMVATVPLLLTLALALGCDGFFVDPVLTGITVGPAVTIQTGNTVQMSAVGTYDDGSQKTLSSNVFWSTGADSIATINKSGMVTGVGPGQATITGASGTVIRKCYGHRDTRKPNVNQGDFPGRPQQYYLRQQRTVCGHWNREWRADRHHQFSDLEHEPESAEREY